MIIIKDQIKYKVRWYAEDNLGQYLCPKLWDQRVRVFWRSVGFLGLQNQRYNQIHEQMKTELCAQADI